MATDQLIVLFKRFLEEHLDLDKMKVLEIGAGEGKFTGLFADITALDIDKEELEELSKNHPDAKIVIGEAQKLPFPDDSFDIVLFSRSLHHVPLDEMRLAIAEARRVAKKYLVFIEPGQKGAFQEMEVRYHDERTERDCAWKLVHELPIIAEEKVIPALMWGSPEDICDRHAHSAEQWEWIKEHLKAFTKDGKIIMTSEHWFAICKP